MPFTVDMALGCSTNTVLHLPAIAHEAGVELNLDIINDVSMKTPHICKLAPAGHHHIEELNAAGGIPAVMKRLSEKNLLATDGITVTGQPLQATIDAAEVLSG